MMAVAQRLDRRLDNMGRRRKVRLADAEVDDVAALPLQFAGAGKDREGVLLAKAREGGNRMQHFSASSFAAPICREGGRGSRAWPPKQRWSVSFQDCLN